MTIGFLEKHDGMRKCKYCGCRKDQHHFKKVFSRTPRRLVGYKCDECVRAGKLSVAERDLRAANLKLRLSEAAASRNIHMQELKAENRIKKLRESQE